MRLRSFTLAVVWYFPSRASQATTRVIMDRDHYADRRAGVRAARSTGATAGAGNLRQATEDPRPG